MAPSGSSRHRTAAVSPRTRTGTTHRGRQRTQVDESYYDVNDEIFDFDEQSRDYDDDDYDYANGRHFDDSSSVVEGPMFTQCRPPLRRSASATASSSLLEAFSCLCLTAGSPSAADYVDTQEERFHRGHRKKTTRSKKVWSSASMASSCSSSTSSQASPMAVSPTRTTKLVVPMAYIADHKTGTLMVKQRSRSRRHPQQQQQQGRRSRSSFVFRPLRERPHLKHPPEYNDCNSSTTTKGTTNTLESLDSIYTVRLPEENEC